MKFAYNARLKVLRWIILVFVQLIKNFIRINASVSKVWLNKQKFALLVALMQCKQSTNAFVLFTQYL